MSLGQWFWSGLTLACLIWYGSVTLYVAIRGLADIQAMLKKLGQGKGRQETE